MRVHWLWSWERNWALVFCLHISPVTLRQQEWIMTHIDPSEIQVEFTYCQIEDLGFPGGSDGKESAFNVRDLGLIPGLGRSPGGGHGNPLQYSCLENHYGKRKLVGCSGRDHKKSDMTEQLRTNRRYILIYRCVSCMYELPCFFHDFSFHVGKSLEVRIFVCKVQKHVYLNFSIFLSQTNKQKLSLHSWSLQKNPVCEWM